MEQSHSEMKVWNKAKDEGNKKERKQETKKNICCDTK
jgi:hypothetical protein